MSVQILTVDESAKMLASGEAILIDVREASEFQAEHIAYAVSLPLGDVSDLIKQMNIPEGRKVIFQCLGGVRSEQACVAVGACGACDNEIYSMQGGIKAWKDAGLPVVGKAQNLSIFRQVQIIVGGLVALCVLLGFSGIKAGFAIAGIFGAALCFAGITGFCALAKVLQKMPWNKA